MITQYRDREIHNVKENDDNSIEDITKTNIINNSCMKSIKEVKDVCVTLLHQIHPLKLLLTFYDHA